MLDTSTYLFLFGFGLFGTWRSWREWKRAQASVFWPRTSGVILTSEMHTDKDEEGESHRGVITYQYEIMGTTYRSERIFYGDKLALQWVKPIQRYLTNYPIGKPVVVSYDPAVPSYAILEPGLNRATILSLLIPVTIAVWALSAAMVGFIG